MSCRVRLNSISNKKFSQLMKKKKLDSDDFLSQKEIFDFGDFDDVLKVNAKKIDHEKGEELFDEYSLVLIEKEELLKIIAIFHEKILALKNNALNDFMKIKNGKANEYEIEKMARSFISDRNEWEPKNGYFPYAIKGESLVESFRYEYCIFELVYIYKIFDFNKNKLFLVQW